MRSYSRYLEVLKSENHQVQYHLGGSTPPLPEKIMKKSIGVSLKPEAYAKQIAELNKFIGKGAWAQPGEISLIPGSTQACFQTLAAITEPNDTIIIEYPGYEPYLAAARFLGLNVLRFQRTPDFDFDLKKLKKLATSAKVLLISNPHCPTGWVYSAADLKKLEELSILVLLDEVFLPLFSSGTLSHRAMQKFSDNFIFISGLSKSTGLGTSRIGWVIAASDIITKVNQIGLHLHLDFPLPIVPVAGMALKNYKAITSEFLKTAAINRELVRNFQQRRPHDFSHDFTKGFFGMLRVPAHYKKGKDFVAQLLQDSILVRDGAYFEMPEWVRIHLLLPPRQFKKAFSIIMSHYLSP